MAFPNTSVLDAFTHAGVGGLNAFSPWIAPIAGISTNSLRYGDNAANTVNPTASTASDYYNVTYGPDCEAFCTILALDTVNTAFWVRLFIRLQNPTNSATRNDYNLEVTSAGSWILAKTVAGVRTVLNTFTQAIQAGDKIGIQAIGTTISVWWWNHNTSTWSQVGSVTDSGVTGSGVLGLAAQGTTGDQLYTIDDFGGGTVSSVKSLAASGISATSTVGGSVTAKHRLVPTSGIQALSTVGGHLGSTGGTGTGPSTGFGISVFGVDTFGATATSSGGGGGGGTGGSGGGTTVTPGQPPIVPPSTPTGDAIIDFIENSPPGLFPENDDSNFGFTIRQLWCNKIEDLIGQQDLIYKERFVANSEIFLDEWERETGTPTNPGAFDLTTRRAIVLGRLRKGPFTRTKRKEIVERYLKATFGGGVTFGPSGIPIGAGIVLTGGTTAPDLSTVYKIVENITGFTYTVYILNTYTPAAGMDRELKRITPAGINYTISFVSTLP